ncbi:MAG: GNAT family N-acetyltransferase [Dethiobacteria bacterium]
MQWLEWKYFKNPYSDKPLVFGAYDENTNKMVGIRPFILCRLVVGNNTFNAAQPCDAAVEHDYRRQGIFEIMNMHAVKELKERGYSLCFNFPNFYSMPGLLNCGYP